MAWLTKITWAVYIHVSILGMAQIIIKEEFPFSDNNLICRIHSYNENSDAQTSHLSPKFWFDISLEISIRPGHPRSVIYSKEISFVEIYQEGYLISLRGMLDGEKIREGRLRKENSILVTKAVTLPTSIMAFFFQTMIDLFLYIGFNSNSWMFKLVFYISCNI